MANIQEFSRDDSHLTNHQRLKDREMQRAHDSGSDLVVLPSRSRLRRRRTTKTKMEKEFKDAQGLPMPSAPDGA